MSAGRRSAGSLRGGPDHLRSFWSMNVKHLTSGAAALIRQQAREIEIGRIQETRGGPEWFWSLTANGRTRADRVATFKEAKAQLQKSWDAWRRGRSWRRCLNLA